MGSHSWRTLRGSRQLSVRPSVSFESVQFEAAIDGQVTQVWVWAVSVVCVEGLTSGRLRLPLRENTDRSRDLKEAAARAQSRPARNPWHVGELWNATSVRMIFPGSG